MFNKSKPTKEQMKWMGFKTSKDKTGKIGDLHHQGTTDNFDVSAMASTAQ
jgi:hypothetical protein